ncbi:MAG TPA: 1-acyl-sn-glycerol-3-phosphate acyltransferase [Anaerolineales bacterium]
MGEIETLTQINLNDLVNAFGWQGRPVLARLIRLIFWRTARDFARQMVLFDSWVGSRGLGEAACLTEQQYVREVRLFGRELLPDGPCILLANHPGMTDALALLAALPRPDLRVVALDRPFLLALPNVSRHLFFVREEVQERFSLVRRINRHLRSGGSILTFPAGHTEPDPDTQTGAVESLQSWTDSAGIFVRLAPDTLIVPVCVRGVNWDKAINHPIARWRRAALDRHLLASAMQLIANVSFHVRPVVARIQIGAPIRAAELGSTDLPTVHRAVVASMRRLIETPPAGGGVSIL